MSLYLILNLASISVPLLYSFEKRMRFIRWWKEVFLSIAIVASLFIIWDIFFTAQGVWGFNERYFDGRTGREAVEAWKKQKHSTS